MCFEHKCDPAHNSVLESVCPIIFAVRLLVPPLHLFLITFTVELQVQSHKVHYKPCDEYETFGNLANIDIFSHLWLINRNKNILHEVLNRK
jgi:hypothetical protein